MEGSAIAFTTLKVAVRLRQVDKQHIFCRVLAASIPLCCQVELLFFIVFPANSVNGFPEN